jgi:hypothetical protein
MHCAEGSRVETDGLDRTMEPVDSDELLRTLDGMMVGTSRRVRVISVVVANARRWIQLDLVGLRHYSLLISVDLAGDAASIRRALQWWLAGDRMAECVDVGTVAIHSAVVRAIGGPAQEEHRVPVRRSSFLSVLDRASDRRIRRG